MQAWLSELIIAKEGLTKSGVPKFINLDDFWLKNKAPTLLKSDIDALMKVKLDSDSLSSIPTPEKWQSAMLDKNYDQTTFEKLAEHSKNQYFFYLQDKYEQYVHFVEHSNQLFALNATSVNKANT